jgi:ubiquinone/menaquinone biosynthesis C-methylase UbiE
VKASKESQYWAKKDMSFLRINPFAKLVVRTIRNPKGKTLLDVGCGFGADTSFLAKKGFAVTAMDFSKSSVAAVTAKAEDFGLHVRALQGDLREKLPFASNSFDVLYAHLSVHYFDDAKTHAVFAELRRVLKPGGLLFVKCKSVEDPLFGKGKKVGEDMYLYKHVRHFFSKKAMQKYLKDFQILRLRKSSSFYDDMVSRFIEATAKKPAH